MENDDDSLADIIAKDYYRNLDQDIQARAIQAINSGTSGTFKPVDWDKMVISADSIYPGTMTGINASSITTSLPGALLEYSMEYDLDELKMSGLPEDQQNSIFKKELANSLVEKMMTDGHIVFTKQASYETHKMRFKAYTWVGNKSFIEDQRKAKSRGI